MPGDVDRDNDVDLDDLNTVRNNFGSASPPNFILAWEFGDMDFSGSVDLNDLNDTRNNFGAVGWPQDPPGLMMMSGAGSSMIGEEALRAALYELYMSYLSSPSKESPYEDLFYWDELGDEEWWKVTLGE